MLVILAVLATIAGVGASYMGSLQKGNGFLEGTVINGENVSGQTPGQVTAARAQEFQNGQVVLLENGQQVFRSSLTDLGYKMDEEAYEKTLTDFVESEKVDIKGIFHGLINGNSLTLDTPYTFDEEVFKNAVKKEALTEPRVENVDAKIVYDDSEEMCRIEPEIQGTELHSRDLREWLKGEIPVIFKTDSAAAAPPAEEQSAEAVTGENASENVPASGEAAQQPQNVNTEQEPFHITLSIPSSIYIPPEKTATDEKLVKKCDILNSFADMTVTYLFGGVTETLTFHDFMNWLKIRGDEVTVRPEKVREYVTALAEKYDTRYRDRVFYTSLGGEVTFPPNMNDYGYTILMDQEEAQLTQDILSKVPVEREPVYITYSDWGNPVYLSRNGLDDLNGTYVEVSISSQHMWYYVNGQLIIESDVVTGDVTENMGTASGVFPLAFKESPSTLRGGEGKKKYTTKVQYWMPFYEGQGLHDAWWKTVFGGTEYMGNGSHGCVNLPSSVAETLYNNIVPGTAIVIYY